ncbi:MAG TPA: hypothetical protein VN673_11510 [Clostridia bacterium]|nr:hypothetical protein [Clostridia bacterium]
MQWISQTINAASILGLLVICGFGCMHRPAPGAPLAESTRSPVSEPQLVINTTDLYFPSQDGGDNFDLVMPYGLDEVQQLLVVLDGNHHLRDPEAQKSARLCRDPRGIARDPGYMAVAQLDHIFARRTQWCIGPWTRMKSEDDRLEWIPQAEQIGIEVFIETLRSAPQPVHVTVFGSARVIAAALNREPALLKTRIAMVHFCAGTAGNGARFLEWNIGLDQLAARRLLGSDLPITLYPCATSEGPFALGRHNGYWQLPNLEFVRDLHPRLRSYLVFQLAPSSRLDTLRAIEEESDPAVLSAVASRPHNVWETCVWLAISGRKLVRRADGTCRILKPTEIGPEDRVLSGNTRPCRLSLNDGRGACRMWFDEPFDVPDIGLFDWEPADEATNRWIYDRGDPLENQSALREALPELYRSFSPSR